MGRAESDDPEYYGMDYVDRIDFDVTNVLVVVGQRGYGKTYFILNGIIKALPKKHLVINYDSVGNYIDKPFKVVEDTDQLVNAIRCGENRITFLDYDADKETFEEVNQIVWETGGCFYTIDEIGDFVSASSIPKQLFS
ncbi:unnamed protein product, partial [marine sediment metagenome]